MSKIDEMFKKINSCLGENGRVLVAVGDMGKIRNDNGLTRQSVVIHCVYIKKSDIMHYSTNFFEASPDEVSHILGSLKNLVKPFYLITEVSDSDMSKFEDLFVFE